MGAAARRNPRALAGKDADLVQGERLQRIIASIPTPLQYQRFLECFPAEDREDVRRLTRPWCQFDPAAIAAEEALISRAATVAARTGGA